MCVVAVRALPYGGSREEGREGRRGAMSPRGARPSASWGSAGQLLERQVGEEASLAEVVEGPLGRTACRGELRWVSGQVQVLEDTPYDLGGHDHGEHTEAAAAAPAGQNVDLVHTLQEGPPVEPPGTWR